MKILEFINIINDIFPTALQEKYDNTGEQILFPQEDITGVFFSLDVDEITIKEALEKNCNLIISHHPLFFKPLSRIHSEEPRSSIIIQCISNRISLFAIHTNLDKIFHNKLAEKLGFVSRQILFPERKLDEGNDVGFGSVVELENNVSLQDLLRHIKATLNLEYLIYTGDITCSISRIAILNGAGGGSIEKILESHDIDCIITGDVNYHNAKYGQDHGISIVDAGHFGTEKILLEFLMRTIDECLTNIPQGKEFRLIKSVNERNPFKVYPDII
jgi:dinuclear metal center YbgI/SA1388 family protein